MIEKSLILVVTGIVIGLVNAVAGGGILVGFPVILFFGLSALVSNATSNVVALAGQLTSSFGYRQHLRKLPKSYFFLLIPALIGGAIGAYILRLSSNTSFLLIAPALIIVAVILFAYQPHIRQRLYIDPRARERPNKPSPVIYSLIFLLSIYGGYFGAGFGLVTLAILSLTRLKSIHEMNGLKNLCALVICLSDIAILFNSHLIDWRYGLTMAIGTAIGGYLGASLAQKLPMKIIRYVVMIIGILTSIYLFSEAHF